MLHTMGGDIRSHFRNCDKCREEDMVGGQLGGAWMELGMRQELSKRAQGQRGSNGVVREARSVPVNARAGSKDCTYVLGSCVQHRGSGDRWDLADADARMLC